MKNFLELKKELLIELNNHKKDEKDFYVALSYILDIGISESYLIKSMSKKNMVKLKRIINKRIFKNIPLNLILKTQNFYGREFLTTKDVLKPRFDTECLVEQALLFVKTESNVLDLCSGSGNIGITINLERGANVTLADISSKALKVAKKNAKKLNANVKILKSDLFKKIEYGQTFDCIVSNPPYLKTAEFMELDCEVKNFDPYIALVAGDTGLEIFEKIAREVKPYLKKGALLFLEVGYEQAEVVLKLFKEQGFKGEIIKDYNNIERIVKCGL